MTPTPTNRMATLVGSWLLLEGVWGLFSPVVLGFITTNRLRAGIHIVLGLLGIVMAFGGNSRKFLWGGGLLVLAVGALYFVPAGRNLTDQLAVNLPAAIINVVVGGSALLCAALCGNDVPTLRR
jgi:hypothetical protein